MKSIHIQNVSTPLYQIENQDDLGLKEVEDFISDSFERNLMNTFGSGWISKFEKAELSLITFGGDNLDYRGGEYVILNVNPQLFENLKESSILSKYQIEYKGELGDSIHIKLIKTKSF